MEGSGDELGMKSSVRVNGFSEGDPLMDTNILITALEDTALSKESGASFVN